MDFATEIARVAALLQRRHPRFPEPAIRALVERSFANYRDATVRGFVAILAYRQADDALRYADGIHPHETASS